MPNFFTLYDNFTKDTEPCKKYHLWTAISVINNCLGKKVWFPMGHFNIYPNLYLLSVGPAGNRKTTALSIGEKLFSQAKLSQVADTASTSEAIIDTMASEKSRVNFAYKGHQQFYQQYSPYCSEFATFLGGKHINEGLIRFLTDIFDPREVYKYKTKNRGEATIENPFFSFTGACTADWFLDNIKEGLLTSGFARRIIFIYSNEIYKENALPEMSEELPTLLQGLLTECSRLAKLVGPFTLDEAAKALHTEAYHSSMAKARETDDFLSSYYGTKSVLVLKVCMGMSAGLGDSRVITEPVYALALRAFDEVESYYTTLFQGTGRNELKKFQEKILDTVAKSPKGCLADKLCLSFFNDMSSAEFRECMQVLLAAGKIRGVAEGDDTRLFAVEDKPEAKDSYILADLASLAPQEQSTLPQANDAPYPLEQTPVVKKPVFKIKLGSAKVDEDEG